jgi:hypothetical protein
MIHQRGGRISRRAPPARSSIVPRPAPRKRHAPPTTSRRFAAATPPARRRSTGLARHPLGTIASTAHASVRDQPQNSRRDSSAHQSSGAIAVDKSPTSAGASAKWPSYSSRWTGPRQNSRTKFTQLHAAPPARSGFMREDSPTSRTSRDRFSGGDRVAPIDRWDRVDREGPTAPTGRVGRLAPPLDELIGPSAALAPRWGAVGSVSITHNSG